MSGAVSVVLAIMVVGSLACSKSSGGKSSDKSEDKTTTTAKGDDKAKPDDDDDGDQKKPAAANVAPPQAVDVAALLKDYGANELKADDKYKGKLIRLSGKVGEVKKDITDQIYVTVGTGAQFELPIAQCFFGDEHRKDAAALTPGQSVKVDCTVDGLMGNVLLKDCSFAPSVALAVCKKLEGAGAVSNCQAKGSNIEEFGAKGSHTAGVVGQWDEQNVFDAMVKHAASKKDLPNSATSPKAHVLVMWKTDAPDDVNPKIKKTIDAL